MKNNKIKFKYLFFIITLIFSYDSLATGNKFIKYTCNKQDTMLLYKEEGSVCYYKVSGDAIYFILDSIELFNSGNNLSNNNFLKLAEDKEEKYIRLLMPVKKKLLTYFSDNNITQILSEKLLIKNINCIVNDCVSFSEIYQKIFSVCFMKYEFKVFDDSSPCCKHIISKILMILKKNNIPLFLPILIPAINKLEKTRELLPIAYIENILYNHEDSSELVLTLTIPKIHDKYSEAIQDGNLNIITAKVPVERLLKDKAKYKINFNTRISTFDLTTSDNLDVSITEELVASN